VGSFIPRVNLGCLGRGLICRESEVGMQKCFVQRGGYLGDGKKVSVLCLLCC
jgi:hypothetical protein